MILNDLFQRYPQPPLRKAGFAVFGPLAAWRHGEDHICVLELRPLTPELARGLGLPPQSFMVNLGCYFLAVPLPYGPAGVPVVDGTPLPATAHCHFRTVLKAPLLPWRPLAREIWRVDPDGANLRPLMRRLEREIERRALPWYRDIADPGRALEALLLHDERSLEELGFGARPHGLRSYLTGYLAIAAGRLETARLSLLAARDSGLFNGDETRLGVDIRRVEERLQAAEVLEA